MKKKVIVTGGAGFIGRYVVQKLLQLDHEVIIYDVAQPDFNFGQHQFTFFEGDIQDKIKLKGIIQGVQEIYHFAGLLGTSELFKNPQEAFNVNVQGLINILELATQMSVKKIFYPSTPYIWRNIYSLTKKTGEELCLIYNRAYGLDVRILRLWNIYGPYQDIHTVRKAVPFFILQALAGKPLEIFGDGNQIVRLVYVQDAAETIIDFVKLPSQHQRPYDLSIGLCVTMTIKELSELIIKLCNSSSDIVFLPRRKGEFDSLEPNHLESVLSILPNRYPTDLYNGLSKTIKYYRSLSETEKEYLLKQLFKEYFVSF
jgi:UDP-glucose 4-epimerase